MMGMVTIQKEYTTEFPITMIGVEAGVCFGSDITDKRKNYTRGIECLQAEHGRTFEFPDVYMILDGYSARVIREWYTHIGGAPTRLQASTRYINYQSGFGYVTPSSIANHPNEQVEITYQYTMGKILEGMQFLKESGIPQEDSALLLPLGMATRIVCKHNLRNLMDMSHQRLCNRAYHEYRELFQTLCDALSGYSDEWSYICVPLLCPKVRKRWFL